MKKIFIFAAVIALLTLSLNAQLKATKNGMAVQPSTEKVDTPPDGYFRMGPSRASTTPVTPPYSNGFNSSSEQGWWEVINANNDGSTYTWAFYSNYARYHWNSSRTADDWLVTAPVVLQAGKTYTFSINAWAETTTYPEKLEVKLASTNTATALSAGQTVISSTTISTTSNSNTLSNQNVTVTTSGNYYFGIHAISDRDMYYLNVDNLEIGVAADPEHDLSIALDAQPASVGAGGTVTLTATVTNTGDYTENGYTVTFTVNGTTIDTQTGTSLATGASTTFTTTYTTTNAQGGTTVNFGANVACTGDADATNNDAVASTAVITLPPPENVQATGGQQSGTMTWDAPSNLPMGPGYVTENFDDTSVFPSLSIGGITATQHTGTFGDWTVYEPSGHYVYSPQNTTFDNDNDPQAWAVMNPTVSGWNIDTPHSGEQFMISFCDAGEDNNGTNIQATNHWLISPELSGYAQTITFYERVITTQYGSETYEVLASSTDNNPTSFTLVKSFTSSQTTWTQRQATLPAGTKYFAIRHTSYDIFGVMIDDVTYQTIVPIEPVSYNVYLEGQLVGNVPSTDALTYTFNNLSDGTYQCSVSAVYAQGESAQETATFIIDNTNPTIEIYPATQTISDAAAGSLTVTGTDITGNINVSADNNWSLNPTSLSNTGGNVSVSYTGRDLSASTTVTATAANDNNVSASATVNYVADVYIVGNFGSGWNFTNGTQMTYNNGTYTATITVDAGNYILFARLLGNNNPWNTREVFGPDSSGDWWVTSDNATGTIDVNDDDPIYFPNGGTYRVTINSDGTLTITKLNGEQTAPPVITYTSDGEYVTITATGDGTVTLNVPGQDPVSGEGEVSITVPCGYASNTITVSATAQETGKDESLPTYEQITIPAGSDWTEMTGTYNNIADLLTFQTKVGNDTTDIMLIDQFVAETKNNSHPDHYTYTLRQTVNGETTTSTPVTIPVYKTSSTMMGLYTLNQVMGDTDMKLKPNVFNTEMDFDANPDHNVLYYSLYRGDKGATYPEITAQSRISQLQKFQENVGQNPDNVQFYFFESHQEGVVPRYLQSDHIGHQVVERLDTNWVEGTLDDMLPYVPVIWTYGLYTARGDGKNNSYGSDIKREYMGKTTAEISGEFTDVNDANGTFEVNGVDYIIYHPVIDVTGYLPQHDNNYEVDYNDGDIANYVPYMCRAWCTTEGIRDFGRDADGHLVDRGALTVPYLLDEKEFGSDLTVQLGGLWTGGSERDAWSFALPATTAANNASVTFIIRFYYKKVVTEAQAQNSGSGAKLGGEAEEYFMAQFEGDADDMVVALNEFMSGVVPVSVTYVNPQGMQSSRPFDGVNIVVTRYSDGTTRTSKIIR